ncbi:tubby C-terminal domain-like protein [Lysinibacillus antri]|uniref:Peptide ABC transporter ATPase n=1 Tax=Lysinibacillus antri TaxID=2498145 RepID=A0A432LEN1_9BACI|nr:peptide ABC transporter ATPase [Lysinibacillus antri]RUL55591.1 peptide ABC transporter ATPase [Lysinibacillus antri]
MHYNYTHPKEIEYTGEIQVFDEKGQLVAISKRIYDNQFKQKLDRMFDYRYFLKYDIYNANNEKELIIKKISRRGKLWYEAVDTKRQKTYIISYENWRIGIPELYISDGEIKIQINKEMEDWSEFVFENEIIAKWKAEFKDDQFEMTLVIHDNSPLQNVAFFIGVCQATLFVGA